MPAQSETQKSAGMSADIARPKISPLRREALMGGASSTDPAAIG
jgi:hypothetical protein